MDALSFIAIVGFTGSLFVIFGLAAHAWNVNSRPSIGDDRVS